MNTSEELKRHIERCGLTRYQLSKMTGVSEAALSLFMSGKRSLTLDTLDKLAPALGLKLVATKPAKRKGR